MTMSVARQSSSTTQGWRISATDFPSLSRRTRADHSESLPLARRRDAPGIAAGQQPIVDAVARRGGWREDEGAVGAVERRRVSLAGGERPHSASSVPPGPASGDQHDAHHEPGADCGHVGSRQREIECRRGERDGN